MNTQVKNPSILRTMQNKLSTTMKRYSFPAIALHWLSAIALFTAFGLALYMDDLPRSSMQKLVAMNWHKWAGTTVLFLTVLRLVWRFIKRPPALPESIVNAMPSWQRMAHHGTHHLMYALLVIVPLSGWLYSSAAGFPIVWFGVLQLPDLVGRNPELAQMIKPIHEPAAYTLIFLIALHVAAAVKHQWFDKDHLIERMLPGRSD